MQGLLPGSVSKYCLQQSPIPVIVVRPSTKREKKKKKRMANPSRKSYNQILELSESKGSHIFDSAGSANSSTTRLPVGEATAVTKAAGVGLQPSPMEHGVSKLSLSREASPLGKSSDDNKNDDNDDSATSPTTSDSKSRRSSDFPAVLTSPSLGNIESPAISDEDEGNDSGDEMEDEEQEVVSPPVSKKEDGTYTAG